MAKLISQKEYARRRRVTPQYINKLVRQGKITLVKGLIDPKRADRERSAWSQPARSSKSSHSDAKAKKSPARSRRVREDEQPDAHPAESQPRSSTGKLTAARAEREHYQSLQAKLEYERLLGQLVPAAEVRMAQERQNANVRTQFRAIARDLAQQLALTTSPAECEQILLDAIDLRLSVLAADPLALRAQPEVPIVPVVAAQEGVNA